MKNNFNKQHRLSIFFRIAVAVFVFAMMVVPLTGCGKEDLSEEAIVFKGLFEGDYDVDELQEAIDNRDYDNPIMKEIEAKVKSGKLAEAEKQIIQESIEIEDPQCMCCGEDVDDIFEHKGVCGEAGHYVCDSFAHDVAECGNATHFICTGGNHTQAVCGTYKHYSCDGRSHNQAVCGKEGHFDCDDPCYATQCRECGEPVSSEAQHLGACSSHWICQTDEGEPAEASFHLTKCTCGRYLCQSISSCQEPLDCLVHLKCSVESGDYDAHTMASCGHCSTEVAQNPDVHNDVGSCGHCTALINDVDYHDRVWGMDSSLHTSTDTNCGHYECQVWLNFNEHLDCIAAEKACNDPNHYICDGKDHNTLAECGQHYNCDGADHSSCPACGNLKCTGEHNVAACGEHFICEMDQNELAILSLHNNKCDCGRYLCEDNPDCDMPLDCLVHLKCMVNSGDYDAHTMADCGHCSAEIAQSPDTHTAGPCGHCTALINDADYHDRVWGMDSSLHTSTDTNCGHYECQVWLNFNEHLDCIAAEKACNDPEHYICDGKDHNSCSACGNPKCTGDHSNCTD